jgi:hypothetical protein
MFLYWQQTCEADGKGQTPSNGHQSSKASFVNQTIQTHLSFPHLLLAGAASSKLRAPVWAALCRNMQPISTSLYAAYIISLPSFMVIYRDSWQQRVSND